MSCLNFKYSLYFAFCTLWNKVSPGQTGFLNFALSTVKNRLKYSLDFLDYAC